ncbi:MAG: DEAD/DEAH box helicase [Chloroflexi bacterium]|nr:DEAD/DEAH box helicase [Chloroflexota bacterium]
MDANLKRNSWLYSLDHHQACRIVETQELWGDILCDVWLPKERVIARVSASRLQSLREAKPKSAERILYIAAAAKITDALSRDALLSPIGATVIPLPHQIGVLSRAMSSERVRFLLADEVGLGKTIEAGLIMRELKLRGLVSRTLVIAPRGLITQWIAEMRIHFGEDFHLLIPSEFSAYRRFLDEDNLWLSHNQVVTPIDSVKPMESRNGWSEEQVEAYNRERFDDLISAGWDLIIVDEAHRLGGSTDQVARHKLGRGLSEASPYFLLLSATPHQGKRDAFHRLVSLIDAQAFPDEESVTRDRVKPFVIRNEKRSVVDQNGQPLFKPRRTELVPVVWEQRHVEQRLLYDAVTDYVREGYNQAVIEKRTHVAFLMLLFQRLVASSTRAIRTSLERRLEALLAPQEQLPLFPMMSEEDWADLDGQEQIETLLTSRLRALKNEQEEVRLLIEAAARCEARGADAKAEALLSWIYQLQAEEGDPKLKIIVFTEFVATQQMLSEFLAERGFTVALLNGSMNMEDRIRAQNAFARDVRILISTEAGGEGLNLQFCHVVINYDLPWNPMRIEQRIGRVDRIGQDRSVRAVNFELEGTVEHRVREVMEEKLAIIFEALGIDKAGDVLDSAQAGVIFGDLYRKAVLDPGQLESAVEDVVATVEGIGLEEQANAEILGAAGKVEIADVQALLNHPLPFWIERMTINYLRSHNGGAERDDAGWTLDWPSGEKMEGVVFTNKEAGANPLATHLSLETPKIRELATRVPSLVEGQPVPEIMLPDLSNEIVGLWSLWRISLSAGGWRRDRVIPMFIADDGRVLAPTARHIWDLLLDSEPVVRRLLDKTSSLEALEQSWEEAEVQGKAAYQELATSYQERLRREREKGEFAFAARRRAIERIGLSQVRHYRLRSLLREEARSREELDQKAKALPELEPLILIQVVGPDDG